MKFFTIFILVIYHSQCVTAIAFVDFVVSTMSEIGSAVSGSLRNLKQRVKDIVQNIVTDKEILNKSKSKIEPLKGKHTFNDFVEKMAAESDTESLEYANLRSEPTALMSTPQLATLHGRRVESHIIHTEDGYLLTLHRVVPLVNTNKTSDNKTVFLHHGILGSSADWILLGPEDSLPYILSDNGYDVWMANARGNYYSRGHSTMKVDSLPFWKFTWNEIGQFDLPAAVNYIRDLKNMSEPINYVGHSMGATALLVFLSTRPQYNGYFRIGIFLAPLAFMSNTRGPLNILAHLSKDPPEGLLQAIGEGELMPSRRVAKWIVAKYCSGYRIFCNNPMFFFCGGIPDDKWNASFTARVLYHVPAGGSTDTILHYAQLVKSGKFHKYNDQISEYPLNEIKLPIALFSSEDDWLATVSDVLRLYFSIGNPIDSFVIRGKKFSHNDFVWGSETRGLVFSKVVEYIENGLNWNLLNNEVKNR